MPSRSKRFILGLLSGYGSIAASVIYTMASVPLALHYLGKQEFGLWALALQVSGYLGLLDLGMGSALSRFLADHKDNVNDGEYGSLLITGGLVFAIQGAAVAVIGLIFSRFAASVFSIPTELADSFAGVLALLAALGGFSIAMKSIGSPLWAFQRMDVINLCSSVGLLLNLPLMWLGFHFGLGIYSLAMAGIPTTLLTLGIYLWICKKNHFYPKSGCWGVPRWDIFKQIFGFGKDIVLITLGSQLINATQIMIVSRILGLDAAATFSIGTKLLTMGQQVFHKVIESAAPGLTEIFVRGDTTRFVQRYWDALVVTLALATLGAVGVAGLNSDFVNLWTHGSISWPPGCDILLALMLVLTSLTRNLVGLFGIVKSFRAVRHLYLVEGLVFIPLAILVTRWFGIPGIIAASILAHLAVTSIFSLKEALNILGSSKPIRPGFAVALGMIALSAMVAWVGRTLDLTIVLRTVTIALTTLLAAYLLWVKALSPLLRNQLTTLILPPAHKLGKFFGISC